MDGYKDYLNIKHAIDALDLALDERDRYTREHCNRLVTLSAATGRLCGLDTESLSVLKMAALFHDLGKIGIPDSILLKEERLTPDEWEVIKTHSGKGERILRKLGIHNGEDIASVVRHHHEHFNGNGYPDGLAGEDIPIMARIISVTDSYDAMTTTRTYARARTPDEALVILHDEEGEKSDPYVFRRFIQTLEQQANTRTEYALKR